MRIPFDSLCLAAVAAEAQALVGARVERVVQVDPLTIVLVFFSAREYALLLSADPSFARAYLATRRLPGMRPLPAFGAALKRFTVGGVVTHVGQVGLDRILNIAVDGPEGPVTLIGEFMGKHANLILVGSEGRVVDAAKRVGPSKSVRPVLPGRAYSPPPFEARPTILEARGSDDLSRFEGASPFLRGLVASGVTLESVQAAVREQRFVPVYSEGCGAYPLSVQTLGISEVRRESVSQALEQHFEGLVREDHVARAKASLRAQLERVALAREVALADIETAVEGAKNASTTQLKGELVLAYQGQIRPGDTELAAWDYEGRAVTVNLVPDLTPVENAQRYFAKARKAKDRSAETLAQRERLSGDLADLRRILAEVESAASLDEVEDLRRRADSRRWLNRPGTALPKGERPFEGHAVRELLSPAGWRVLFGENSTANDYLTTKFARPGDLWFHVRGAPSAHVVLCTNNQPQRVQTPDLEFAARVAVSHSPAKHSGYVSVDYTQKRYVRKPRGAAPGLAVYTHEKTLHVHPTE